MKVMIGVDPHKGSHTATMLDRHEHEVRRIRVRAGGRQVDELRVGRRCQASDVGGGVRRRDGLSARPAVGCRRRDGGRCACHVGVAGTRPRNRSVDEERSERARSIAVAALHAPSLAVVRPADHVTVCRLWPSGTPTWPGGGPSNAASPRVGGRAGARRTHQEVPVTRHDPPRGIQPVTWRRSSGTVRPSSSSPTSNARRRLERTRGTMPPSWPPGPR